MSDFRESAPGAGCSRPQAMDGFAGQSDPILSHIVASGANEESDLHSDQPGLKVLFDHARPKDERLRLTVQPYLGKPRIDFRLWYTDKNGNMQLGRKGFTVPPDLIAELVLALAQATTVRLEDLGVAPNA